MMNINTQLSPVTEIDKKNPKLYTPEQVETITSKAIKYALEQISAMHLDSSIPQISPAMTIAEAAQTLKISKPTMYELIRSKQIHAVNVGKKILVSRQSLLDWVEGRS